MSSERGSSSALYTPGVALMPEDFADKLTALKEASGLSWDGLAACLGVDDRQLLRWRKGSEPCGGAMLALVRLATRVPGGLGGLLDEELTVVHGRGRQRYG